MREVTVAATQMACSNETHKNVSNAEKLVRQAASEGAQIILIQELFESQYFCMDQKEELFELSKPFEKHPTIKKFSELAKELKVVLPVSFFEKANRAYYNSVAIVDADGSILGNTESHTFLMDQATKKSFILILETQVSKYGIQNMPRLGLVYVGSSGFQRPQGPWY